MPTSPVSIAPRRCQADPRCGHTPCFRVELHDPPGTVVTGKTLDTCADHLGDAAASLVHWAEARQLDCGRIQVCAVDAMRQPPEPGFPFASIPLGRARGCPAAHSNTPLFEYWLDSNRIMC